MCEVSQRFNVSLQRTQNLPLTIKLYKDERLTKELRANSEGYYEEESFQFEAGRKSEITIYIRIEWNAGMSDYTYNQEIENISVYTNITQLD